jgi:multicomponent Na+:H+ antiporter subunit F
MPDPQVVYLVVAVLLTLIALGYTYRVVVGPPPFDRLLCLAGIGTKAILVLVMIGALFARQDMLIDIALGYALLNFVAALVSAKYLEERSVEP